MKYSCTISDQEMEELNRELDKGFAYLERKEKMTDLITCTCGHDKSWHDGGPTGHSPINACTYTGCECLGFRSGDIADEEGDVESTATYNPTPSMPDAEPHNDEPPYEPPPYDWEPGGGSSGGGGASGDV